MMLTRRKISIAILLPLAALLFLLADVKVAAVSGYESDSNIAAGIVGTAGTGASYDLSMSGVPILGPLFSTSPENYGQNMYTKIYERIKSQGSDIAISRTLARRPLSKEELLTLIPGSNIGALIKEPDPNKNLSPQEVNARMVEFERDLAEEKVLADLFVETKMATEPTEMFANGDEGDSGFDLLVDLDIIDQILFGRIETVLGGSGPGSPTSGSTFGPGTGAGADADADEPAGGAGAPGAVGGPGAAAGSGGPRGPTDAGAGTVATEPSPEEAAVLCPVNIDFNSAIVEARSDERAEEERRGGAGGGSGGGAGGRSGGGLGGSGGAGGAAEVGDDGANEDTPIEPEESGEWSRPRICTTRFCLRLEAVYKTESAYLANENCIACHFEKINDAFKKTLDHNIVPSKATGNLIEGPKCKRGLFGGLKFNVVLIPQPIMTPPNDDIVVKGDFIRNAMDFYEKYYDNPDRCVDGVCKNDPDPQVEAARTILEQTPEGTSQAELLQKVRTQVAAKKAEAAAIMKKARMDSDAQNQASQYRVFMQEIDSFNSYFRSFVTLYETIVSDDPDYPCEMLLNKPTCS